MTLITKVKLDEGLFIKFSPREIVLRDTANDDGRVCWQHIFCPANHMPSTNSPGNLGNGDVWLEFFMVRSGSPCFYKCLLDTSSFFPR